MESVRVSVRMPEIDMKPVNEKPMKSGKDQNGRKTETGKPARTNEAVIGKPASEKQKKDGEHLNAKLAKDGKPANVKLTKVGNHKSVKRVKNGERTRGRLAKIGKQASLPKIVTGDPVNEEIKIDGNPVKTNSTASGDNGRKKPAKPMKNQCKKGSKAGRVTRIV